MLRRRPAILLAAATGIAAFALPIEQASSKVHVIRADQSQVTRIGAFRTDHTRSYAPMIRQARRAFGRPSNTFKASRFGGCVVKWDRLGLRILFTSFGAPPRDHCRRDVGLAQSFSVYKRQRVETWRGLHIGVADEEVEDFHPKAEFVVDDPFYPDGWWLRTAVSQIGRPHEYPVVEALVADGAVSSIEGWIGAAGD